MHWRMSSGQFTSPLQQAVFCLSPFISMYHYQIWLTYQWKFFERPCFPTSVIIKYHWWHIPSCSLMSQQWGACYQLENTGKAHSVPLMSKYLIHTHTHTHTHTGQVIFLILVTYQSEIQSYNLKLRIWKCTAWWWLSHNSGSFCDRQVWSNGGLMVSRGQEQRQQR